MNMKKVYLKRNKEESLLRYHPWVFSGAIHHTDEGVTEGDTVLVVTSEDYPIAVGHYQHGTIAVRVLSFTDRPIDDDFWYSRLSAARDVRQTIGLAAATPPVNDTYRLVHGEGDQLPGLIIDIYGSTAVMQAHSLGMHRSRHDIARQLVSVMQGSVNNVYYKSEGTLAFAEPDDGFLIGGSADNIATENGLRFHVDWLHGQKTGFFIDQRDNRSLLEHYASGRRVLNMFCYTGGFSVYAMRGGATIVHSVDSSAKAIELTRGNVELNFPGDPRHEAFCDDAFHFIGAIGQQQDYDLVVLDPPAFAKHRGALPNALRGYTRLNQKALEMMPPASLLFTFSCSQVVTKEQFRLAVFTAAAQAHRSVRILHQLHQPADHPINIYHPEGEYLKGLVLYVE